MAENRLGVQTRSMVDAQCNEDQTANPPEQQPAQEITNNPTPAIENLTDPQNPVLNPTVELTRMETDNMIDYVRKFSNISSDWYVPDLNKSHVRDIINNRLPMGTGRTKILVTCPLLREFFTTSTFEIDLNSGRVYTFLLSPEDIGVPCQQEDFDLNLLRK